MAQYLAYIRHYEGSCDLCSHSHVTESTLVVSTSAHMYVRGGVVTWYLVGLLKVLFDVRFSEFLMPAW